MSEELEGKHGVQSLEIGMGILRAMVNGQRSMMLKDIAAAADMPASKAHRYLVSLIRAGLVEQDPLTSRYDLGGFALNIGLVAIDRLDRVRLGLSEIARLRDEINETTALAVWSENGPVIVRWERPRRAITVNVVTGTALHILNSASGRIFAAWLKNDTVDRLIGQELKNKKLPPHLQDPSPGRPDPGPGAHRRLLRALRLLHGQRRRSGRRPGLQLPQRNHDGHRRRRGQGNVRHEPRQPGGFSPAPLGQGIVVAAGLDRRPDLTLHCDTQNKKNKSFCIISIDRIDYEIQNSSAWAMVFPAVRQITTGGDMTNRRVPRRAMPQGIGRIC